MFSVSKRRKRKLLRHTNDELTQKVVDLLVDVLGPRQVFGSFDLSLHTNMKIHFNALSLSVVDLDPFESIRNF
jgi:hypothetical protein